MSSLTSNDIEKFWHRVYFGTSDEKKIKYAIIDRAYRDFSRTLVGIGKNKSLDSFNKLKEYILSVIDYVNNHEFTTQDEFDDWHRTKCNELKESFKNSLNYPVSYGQTQKWINMTLKYMFAINFDKKKYNTNNYRFFHIPLDNVIQDKLEELNIPRINLPWSRIDDYDIYLDYQKVVRKSFVNEIPMDKEFMLFNNL